MKTIIQLTLVILAVGIAPLPSPAATNIWRGGVFSTAWSEPNNWDPTGVPRNGDTLIFPDAPLGVSGTMVNDLTDLVVTRLLFDGDQAYRLQGNTLTVSRGIFLTDDQGADVEIQCGLVLADAFAVPIGVSYYSGGDLEISGPINLNGHTLRVSPEDGTSVTLSGVISGTGTLLLIPSTDQFGIGTVRISGPEPNTFVGAVNHMSIAMSGARVGFPGQFLGANLELDKESGPAVPGSLSIGINCRVTLKRSHQIANNSAVSVRGGGRLRLEGHTEAIGSLSLTGESNGAWAYGYNETLVDTGGATLSVEGTIAASHQFTNNMPIIRGQLGLPPGSHIIHTTGNNEFALKIEAQIIGDGGFTKTGASGLILEGNNSFNGDAVIQEGGVDVFHNNGLGSPVGATIFYGGSLSLNGVAVGPETLFVDRVTTPFPELGGLLICIGVCSWAGPIELNTNLTVVGGTMTLSGQITGPGGMRFLVNERVQLSGSDANTYTGDTVSGATLLELNKPSGVSAFRGRLIVDSVNGPREVRWLQNYQCVGADVTLFSDGLINLNNHREDFGPVTFRGGAITTGATGELGLYGLLTANASSTQAYISGRLGLPPGLHEFRVHDGAAFPDLWIDATVLGAGSLRKTGDGQMWMTASNTYEGLTTVAEGALSIFHPNGLGASSAGTTVNEGATLELSFDAGSMPEPLALRGTGFAGNGALGAFGNVTLRTQFPSIDAAIDLTTDTTIGVASNGRLTVDGTISGTGPLRKVGPGTLVLANVNPNTYSGDTFATEGVLNLSKPNSAISVPGNLIVGPAPLNSSAIARWSTPGGMNPDAVATINAGSLLDLNGNDQTLSRLNLNDGGDAQTGADKLSFTTSGLVNVGSLSLLGSHEGSSLTGNIGLAPNVSLTFAVSAFAPTPPFSFGPELEVNAAIPAPVENVRFERAGLTKTGVGRMRIIGNNSFRGWVNIDQGTLTVAGGTALGAATFTGGTYVYNTGLLQLEGGVTVEGESLVLNGTAAPELESVFGESYWGGPVSLLRDSTVGAAPNSLLQIAGVISGTANFTKVGAGTLRFGGADHNTYSGVTFVDQGVLLMSKPTGITAVPSTLIIGTPAGLPATAANLSSYQIIGGIVVNRGGLLNLNGQVENVYNLVLNEGGDVETSTGVLFQFAGGSIFVFPGAVNDPATIAGNLDMDAGTHILDAASSTSGATGPHLEIRALITSSLGAVTLQKNGAGTVRLAADNSYSGTAVVNEGVLRVDGFQIQNHVQVNASGTLQGVGGVNNIICNGGVIAPGASPGVLRCEDFNLGPSGSGILEMELNGPMLGANGYDNLYAGDTVNLSGITLRVRANFSANTNQQFVLIVNEEDIPVQGTFNGLPQNATVTAGDQIFRISYVGGDGNDVVLTKIADVFRPGLMIERVAPSSVRLRWPTNDPAFLLQFNTNLGGANWSAATPLPAVTGTDNVVTNAIGDARKFYRLFKP